VTTPAPASGDDIPIDVDLIKVLASDTRRDILRLLGERRRTLSELAEATGLKKATILEHLEKLVGANLIRRIDDGERIWVYYELTHRGLRIVRPARTTRFYLIMAGSALALVLLGAVVAANMMGGFGGQVGQSASDSTGQLYAEGDVRASAPLVVYRGFDDRVSIGIDGPTPEGSMLLVAEHELAVSDGRAVLDASTVDALPEGRHALRLRTPAGELALPSFLDVREPPVALAPLALGENSTGQLLLSVGAPGMPPPSNLTVLVEGEPVELTLLGREYALGRTPDAPGAFSVRVGRLVEREILVLPEVDVLATRDNDTLLLTLSDKQGPVAGAEVALAAQPLGVSDENGTVVAAWPAEGEHALRVLTADGRDIARAVLVDESGMQALPARLSLAAYSEPGIQTLAALVDVTNHGVVEETVTLVARLDGTAIASTRVDVAAGARAEARLFANVPLTAPVVIEAYGARAASTPVLAGRYAALEPYSGSPNASGGEEDVLASAPRSGWESDGVAAGTSSEKSTAALRMMGRAPDATTTLYPLGSPLPQAAEGMAQSPEPQVPFPPTALLLAAVAAMALLLRRRAGAR